MKRTMYVLVTGLFLECRDPHGFVELIFDPESTMNNGKRANVSTIEERRAPGRESFERSWWKVVVCRYGQAMLV